MMRRPSPDQTIAREAAFVLATVIVAGSLLASVGLRVTAQQRIRLLPASIAPVTVTITAPTSSTTYDAGTAATLTTLAGTASVSGSTITGCTWTNSLGGSGSATGTTSWSVASIDLTVGSNVLTVTCTSAQSATGQDVLTVARASGGGGGDHWPNGSVAAASCNRNDVNTAIGTAVDGQRVTIPNGSCSWTTGIVTTKQIWVRALNYTATDEGTCTRNVTITNNNSSTPLFDFTSGNTYHVGLSGIRINEGTGTNNHIELNGSGSKVPLLSDLCLEVEQRNGSATEITMLDVASAGGVIFNTRFVGIGTGPGGSNGPDGSSFLIKSTPRAWETASTLGALDTAGAVNLYMEDSSCFDVGQFPDVDDHGRFVSRYNDLDGCWSVMHAFTSIWGGRHWEYYNNVFSVTDTNRNMAGRYTWMRGGHGVYTNNVVNTPANTSEWGNSVELSMGESNVTASAQCGGSDPCDRAVGVGYNGSTYVQDAVYVWNETGGRAHTFGCCQQDWATVTEQNEDYFINNGAKPGYSKYTYPHPLRAGVVP